MLVTNTGDRTGGGISARACALGVPVAIVRSQHLFSKQMYRDRFPLHYLHIRVVVLTDARNLQDLALTEAFVPYWDQKQNGCSANRQLYKTVDAQHFQDEIVLPHCGRVISD